MTTLERIYRQPTRLLAFVAAVLAVLTGFNVLDQVGATIALGVVSAAIGLLFYFVTPAAEVVAQRLPGAKTAIAGPAAYVETGDPVKVRPLLEE